VAGEEPQGGLRALALAALVPLTLAASRATPDPAQALAGRYYHQFADALVTGDKYTGEDIVEIVPVAASAAYFRIHLDYYNGHTCDISGVARTERQALVYRDSEKQYDGTVCVLRMRHAGKSLVIDDGEQSCKSACGARGSLSAVTLPYSSKRPIRYLARLKASDQYRFAIAEWRMGKSAR